MNLHHCDACHERTEVWKRDNAGRFFTYCINRGCPRYRREKIALDKNSGSGTIGNTTPENLQGLKTPEV